MGGENMKRYVAVLAFMVLGGCATTANYEKMLQSWVGATEYDLVGKWGPPASVYELGGTKYLTYTNTAQGYVPGTPPSYMVQRYGTTSYVTPVGGSPGFAYTAHCQTTFTLTNGVITSWRWQGNACKSKAQ